MSFMALSIDISYQNSRVYNFVQKRTINHMLWIWYDFDSHNQRLDAQIAIPSFEMKSPIILDTIVLANSKDKKLLKN